MKLVPVDEENWSILESLLQDYLAELSVYSGDQPGPEGRYAYHYLSHYQREVARRAFLFETGQGPMGFMMIREDRDPLSGEPEQEIAEMYVVPGARRDGLGRLAFRQVINTYPGRWRLGILPANKKAAAFWRTVVRETCGEFDEMPPVGPRDRHLLLRFTGRIDPQRGRQSADPGRTSGR